MKVVDGRLILENVPTGIVRCSFLANLNDAIASHGQIDGSDVPSDRFTLLIDSVKFVGALFLSLLPHRDVCTGFKRLRSTVCKL
jgi:hypothetical protein